MTDGRNGSSTGSPLLDRLLAASDPLAETDRLLAELETDFARRQGAARIGGSLMRELVTTPDAVARHTARWREVEGLCEVLEALTDEMRAGERRRLLETSRRRLSARDVDDLAGHAGRAPEMRLRALRCRCLERRFAALVRALATKSYHLTAIARMRAAGVEDVLLDEFDPLAAGDGGSP